MKNKFYLAGIVLAAAIIVLVSVLSFQKEYQFKGAVIDPPMPAPNFELTGPGGQTFILSSQQGKIVLLFFGYTSCPDVCPTTLADFKKVLNELEGQAQNVQVLFITVDPQRDTPERLEEYVTLFNTDFIGLSGSSEVLEQVWAAYGVFSEIDETTREGDHYIVNHSARLYLIDQAGNLRITYSYGTPVDDLFSDISYLLKNE
jgi:protein SCO1/2